MSAIHFSDFNDDNDASPVCERLVWNSASRTLYSETSPIQWADFDVCVAWTVLKSYNGELDNLYGGLGKSWHGNCFSNLLMRAQYDQYRLATTIAKYIGQACDDENDERIVIKNLSMSTGCLFYFDYCHPSHLVCGDWNCDAGHNVIEMVLEIRGLTATCLDWLEL